MTDGQLIKLIEQCAESNGISPSTVTSRAVGNSRLYRNLVAGKSCTLQVAGRIEEYVQTLSKKNGEAA